MPARCVLRCEPLLRCPNRLRGGLRCILATGFECAEGEDVGDVVELFGGPVARLYRRSLSDQRFEVLMVAVFDIAARQGYGVARGIVKELAAAQYPLGGSLAPCPSPRRA